MQTPDWLGRVAGGRVPVGGDQLRAWGICDTWRVRWADGTTTVAKRVAGEELTALDVYERLLVPHRIPAPRLLAADRAADHAVLMFEDVGRHSLAETPSLSGFMAAARLLAHLRHDASGLVDAEFRFGREEILAEWERAVAALAAVRPDLAGALDRCGPALEPHLAWLDATIPDTIVHGDYEAKNLVVGDDGGLHLIDWATAQVGAHLSDLYSLRRDAARLGYPTAPLVDAYIGAGGDATGSIDRQLAVGGVIWTLRALRWVLEEGIHVTSDAITWVDELVQRARRETDRLI